MRRAKKRAEIKPTLTEKVSLKKKNSSNSSSKRTTKGKIGSSNKKTIVLTNC